MEERYSLDTIDAFAKSLVETLEHKIILFDAPMGAGKTTLIKSMCKALGIEEEISSPTYSLVNTYKNDRVTIHHFDLYRIEHIDELHGIGFEEYLNSTDYVFIEWPDIARSWFTDKNQTLVIYPESHNVRRLKIS